MKIKNKILFLVFLLSLSVLTSCSNNSEKSETKMPIYISAASSLINPLDEIIKEFNSKYSNFDIRVTYDSSGTLATQIFNGSPTDIFISASEKNTKNLMEQNMLDTSSSYLLLQNKIVLVTRKDVKLNSIPELINENIKTIGIGEPSTVPAGQYAFESLISMGLYESIKDKLILGKNASEVLTFVNSSNVDAAIIFSSDIDKNSNFNVVETFEDDTHSQIKYIMSFVKDSKNSKNAKKFSDFLLENGKDIFEKYGFVFDGAKYD